MTSTRVNMVCACGHSNSHDCYGDWSKHAQRHHPEAAAAADEPHPTDCRCACDGCRHHNANPIPDPRAEYSAALEAAIGLNVDCGGSAGVHRVRDAVLAVRDLELEQARASREQWRRDYAELVDRHKRMAAELDASERRAVRIQTLLDEQRDQARKMTSLLIKVTAQAMAAPPLEQFMGDEPTEYAEGWAAAMSRIEGVLNPEESTP